MRAWNNGLKRIPFLIALCAAGCMSTRVPSHKPVAQHGVVTPSLLSHAAAPKDLLSVNSIVIAPPQFDRRSQEAERSQDRIFNELQQAAREQSNIEVASGPELDALLKTRKAAQDWRAVAKRVGSDAVLSTTILKFVEREGSAVGATTPAAVNFTMSLNRASDGKEVWSASYHFQDDFLSENLFKVRQRFQEGKGPGWRSARDLLAEGFRSAFQELATRRFEQFSGGSSAG